MFNRLVLSIFSGSSFTRNCGSCSSAEEYGGLPTTHIGRDNVMARLNEWATTSQGPELAMLLLAPRNGDRREPINFMRIRMSNFLMASVTFVLDFGKNAGGIVPGLLAYRLRNGSSALLHGELRSYFRAPEVTLIAGLLAIAAPSSDGIDTDLWSKSVPQIAICGRTLIRGKLCPSHRALNVESASIELFS